MRKFSDKELELAPQVAEAMFPDGPHVARYVPRDFLHEYIQVNLLEHDCLEFLRGRENVSTIEMVVFSGPIVDVCVYDFDGRLLAHARVPTLLEALYRVIVEGGAANA